jgi:cytochrome c553
MQPVAKALDASQLAAVAAHYSKLAAPSAAAVPHEEAASPAQPGAWLAQRGRWDAGLPACVQCHGPGGAGVGTAFPPLRGQSAAYIASQLHAFKQGSRPPGPMKLMAIVAAKLSDDDIGAVSQYYGAQVEEAGLQTTEERK